jgi:predicted Rossmann fold flavoprotein
MSKASIIGAGAAGCLAAVELKRRCPDTEVVVLEAGPRPLAKVALTGGGRCNLTNTFAGVGDLREAYPRGFRLMKRALKEFGPRETMRWFEAEGVALTEEDGGRIFPASGDAMQVVRALLRAMDRAGVKTVCNGRVTDIRSVLEASDAVIVTTGGSPKRTGLGFLDPLGLEIEEPVPSLFTLKTGENAVKALMGMVAPDAVLSIPGTAFRSAAPLLLTDWGFGGPATLKLSSYAARHLAGCGYRTPLSVNWTGESEQAVREALAALAADNARKMAANTPLSGLPSRLWTYLLERSGLRADIRWAEMGSKGLNRLVSTLVNDGYDITGRAAFKEEFVTCGGVSLRNLDPATLQAKSRPGLWFAGEVLDIDAVTGGFNLQAAWTTGWICARSAADYLKK